MSGLPVCHSSQNFSLSFGPWGPYSENAMAVTLGSGLSCATAFSTSRLPFNSRIVLLLRLKIHPKRNFQGLSGLRRNYTFHVLSNISFTSHTFCQSTISRRLCVSCSLNHGSESGSIDERNNHEFHTKSQRRMDRPFKSPSIFAKTVLIDAVKVLLSIVILLSLGVAGAPAVLSSRYGRWTVVGLVNKAIPGHVDVQSMSLGWSKPIHVEGISLKGIDGKVVLSVIKMETKASLWSLVHGKSGLGDCTIFCPKIDLQDDDSSGLLKIALALAPASKLSHLARQARASPQLAMKRALPSVDIALSATVKAFAGGLKVIDGKLIVRNDIAATLGKRVFIDVLLGRWAVEDDDDIREAYQSRLDFVPLKAELWSDEGTQAEAIGFIHLRRQLIELIRPIKVEMDLGPAVAQLYLSQINPLLGEVIGPAVQDEDMPDVVLYVSPKNLMLPAEKFKIALEPMKAVLARGPLAGGILSLLSMGNEDVAKGREEVSVQTSRIESHVSMDGSVECSRIDFLIAGKVAVATWGVMNWIDEGVKITIAVPSTTFRNLFGWKLSEDYYLKIPVWGTLEHPQVDWEAAAMGVAQLYLRQRGGRFFRDFMEMFDSDESVPDPIHTVPWIHKP